MTILQLLQDQPASAWQDLPPAILKAKAAIAADDSHDDIRDGLIGLLDALGEEMPECLCDAGIRGVHAPACPMYAWEAK